jgi:hypothetical protein
MDANQAHFVVCHKGVFVLPDAVYESLSGFVTHGALYVREDEDVLTISTSRIDGGYRRAAGSRFRIPMFRGARTLGIVDLRDSLRVMIVR